MNLKETIFKSVILKTFFFAAMLCFFCGSATAQTTLTQSFTSNGSWVVPAGVTEVTIECWGAGGAGSYRNAGGIGSPDNPGAGGGGGAYAKKVLTVEAGKTLTVVVGQGGSGTQSVSGNGGESSVSYNSAVVAKAVGGTGATNNSAINPGLGGNKDNCIGDVRSSGGNGGKGSGDTSGGGGAAGGAGGDGGNGHDAGNGGTVAPGSPNSGNGGNSVTRTLYRIDGVTGNNYGGGGSGCVSGWMLSADGGNGANGYVLLTYRNCGAVVVNPGTITKETWTCSAIPDTTIVLASVTEATPTPGSYSWQLSTNNGSTWSAITGANANSYTATATGWYRRAYTVTGCDITDYTGMVEVTHPGEIDPGTISDNRHSADTVACDGTDLSVTLTTTSTYPDKTWQITHDNGLTWSNLATVTPLVVTVDHPIMVRCVINYSSTCELISNNYYTILPVLYPSVTKLIPSDTCAGPATYTISAEISPSSGTYTYFWNGSATGTSENTLLLSAYTPEKCNHKYTYSLKVKDQYGCASSVKIDSFKTPAENFTPIVEVTAQINPANCKYVVPNLKDSLESCFHSSCPHIIDASYTQDVAAGTEIAPNTYVMVNTEFNTECDNHYTPTIKVIAPAAVPPITAADIDFDDSNDTIKLYYGICDTLYYVHIPTYSTTSSSPYSVSDLILSNNKSTDNEGTLLGRIPGGSEDTIVWRLTSPCGNYVEYTKIYVVMYPPCGGTMTVDDADGITYQTVRVGCECWTKPNLKTTTGVTGNSYVYRNDDSNIEKFGRLYSWYSAVGLPENSTNTPDTITDPVSHVKYIQGICPAGWGLPTTASFESMLHAAGEDVKNIKSSNISTWLEGMTGTDATGFGAVGTGFYMDASPYFFDLLGEAFFWTSEGAPVEKKGTCCSITLTCPKLLYYTTDAHMGYSIRCVKRKND